MFETACDMLTDAGYEHYEISNFCKPGHRSQHNSGYWKGISYMGIGAAAHSFCGDSRQWNVADLQGYIGAIVRGELPCERETLDLTTRFNDVITTATRTCEGISLDYISNNFGKKYLNHLLREAERHLKMGLLKIDNGSLRLTRKGIFTSDMIMADLIYV